MRNLRSSLKALGRFDFLRGNRDKRSKIYQKGRTLTLEALEQRQLLAIDVAGLEFGTPRADWSAEYEGNWSLKYDVTGDDAGPFEIGIYMSSDGITPERLLTSHSVTGTRELSPGNHTVTITPDFVDTAEDYHLVAQFDRLRDLDELDETNNVVPFAGGVFKSTDGVVHVHGTKRPETIEIQDWGRTELRVQMNRKTRHQVESNDWFYLHDYSSVNVRSHGGDDTIDLL